MLNNCQMHDSELLLHLEQAFLNSILLLGVPDNIQLKQHISPRLSCSYLCSCDHVELKQKRYTEHLVNSAFTFYGFRGKLPPVCWFKTMYFYSLIVGEFRNSKLVSMRGSQKVRRLQFFQLLKWELIFLTSSFLELHYSILFSCFQANSVDSYLSHHLWLLSLPQWVLPPPLSYKDTWG